MHQTVHDHGSPIARDRARAFERAIRTDRAEHGRVARRRPRNARQRHRQHRTDPNNGPPTFHSDPRPCNVPDVQQRTSTPVVLTATTPSPVSPTGQSEQVARFPPGRNARFLGSLGGRDRGLALGTSSIRLARATGTTASSGEGERLQGVGRRARSSSQMTVRRASPRARLPPPETRIACLGRANSKVGAWPHPRSSLGHRQESAARLLFASNARVGGSSPGFGTLPPATPFTRLRVDAERSSPSSWTSRIRSRSPRVGRESPSEWARRGSAAS